MLDIVLVGVDVMVTVDVAVDEGVLETVDVAEEDAEEVAVEVAVVKQSCNGMYSITLSTASTFNVDVIS